MTEQEILQKVIDCQDWKELKLLVKEIGIFEGSQRSYSSFEVLKAMDKVRQGHPLNAVTRACGLRAKVAELILAKNYGDPWE